MIAAGSRSERTGNEQDLPPGRPKWIAVRSTRSNVIGPHAVVARSAVATLVLITAAAVVAAWAALAAAVVFREVEVDFEEVAVADGDVGRFRSGGDFPTREPRSRLGRCHARAHDTQEAAAAHFDVEFSAQPLRLCGFF